MAYHRGRLFQTGANPEPAISTAPTSVHARHLYRCAREVAAGFKRYVKETHLGCTHRISKEMRPSCELPVTRARRTAIFEGTFEAEI